MKCGERWMSEDFFYLTLARLFGPVIKKLFQVHYENLDNIPQTGGLVVCCNHKSKFDPILLALAFRRQIRYMAELELFTDYGRLFRNLLYALGAFPVRRSHGDLSAVETAEQIVKGGGIVGIFPQGGYRPDQERFRPKTGAARIAADTRTPILPAAILCRGVPRFWHSTVIRFGGVISVEQFPSGKTILSTLRN